MGFSITNHIDGIYSLPFWKHFKVESMLSYNLEAERGKKKKKCCCSPGNKHCIAPSDFQASSQYWAHTDKVGHTPNYVPKPNVTSLIYMRKKIKRHFKPTPH